MSDPLLFVDTSEGKVGVGTGSPGAKLHVNGNVDNVGISIQNNARKYTVGVRGDTSDVFSIVDDTAAEFRAVIDSSGNLGVGTASPGGTLDVAAQHGDITNPMVHFRANRDGASNGDGNVLKLENSGNRSDVELLQCVSSGNDRFIVRANGELAINGTTMSKAPRIVHIDDTVPGCPPTRPAGDIMSYSLVLTRPAYVYVSVTTILNYGARSDCEIYFGSTHIQSHLTAADNTGWNPVCMTAGGTVPAGTTNIRFRSNRANVVGCQNNWGGMQILIFET